MLPLLLVSSGGGVDELNQLLGRLEALNAKEAVDAAAPEPGVVASRGGTSLRRLYQSRELGGLVEFNSNHRFYARGTRDEGAWRWSSANAKLHLLWEGTGRAEVYMTSDAGRSFANEKASMLPSDSTMGNDSDGLAKAGIVVMAHNRPDTLRQVLSALFKQPIEDLLRFEVSVSMDIRNSGVEAVAHSFTADILPARRVKNIWQHPQLPRPTNEFEAQGYYKITQHFKHALERGFVEGGYSHLLLLEDDLVPSPDFLSFFRQGSALLEKDPSLWCVSAWNDLGFQTMVQSQSRVFRTGYFPGLGWMIKRQLWVDELSKVWPNAATTGWDHWMRLDGVSKGRECVVPEVSRVRHIGSSGTTVNDPGNHLYSRFAVADVPPAALTVLGGGRSSGLASSDYDFAISQLFTSLQGEETPRITISKAASLYHATLSGVRDPAGVHTRFVVPYQREEWEQLKFGFGFITGQPRATHKGAIVLHLSGVTLVLADRRKCAWLRPNEKLLPDPKLQPVAGLQGETCDHACSRLGKRCQDAQIEFVNSCAALAAVFQCANGCGHQVGLEIPCEVVDPNKDTYGQCLTTDEGSPTCRSSFVASRRLCACI
jgi:hypothetical protein